MLKKLSKLLPAIFTIAIGILIIILKGEIISIAITVFAAVFAVLGIIDLFKKQWKTGIIELIIAAAVIVLGWVFTTVAYYVLAALLLLYGVYQIYLIFKFKGTVSILSFITPLLSLATGVCMFFGEIGWVFIVVGALLIVDGVLGLLDGIFTK